MKFGMDLYWKLHEGERDHCLRCPLRECVEVLAEDNPEVDKSPCPIYRRAERVKSSNTVKRVKTAVVEREAWTAGELAEAAGVSGNTVRRMVRSGELESRLLPGQSGYKYEILGVGA